jgi:hypothetical protein
MPGKIKETEPGGLAKRLFRNTVVLARMVLQYERGGAHAQFVR